MPIRNHAFIDKLLRRQPPLAPLSVSELARQLGIGRAHLTQVLRGQRRGVETWPRLKKFLTAEEYNIARREAGFPLP